MVPALREVIQSRQADGQVVHDRQLAGGVTNRYQTPYVVTTDDGPIHVSTSAVHAYVVQRCEGRAAGEVNGSQVKHELLGDPDMALDVVAQIPGVQGVNIAHDGDDDPGWSRVAHNERCSSAALEVVGPRVVGFVKLDGARGSHRMSPKIVALCAVVFGVPDDFVAKALDRGLRRGASSGLGSQPRLRIVRISLLVAKLQKILS